ncbi:alanine/glycine:cation symporter family protein [Micrococcoides hystricis]|uniref:Alanine/glycine:cation symporter family protein n=1 Tax=Micrococcoides hystricis TaxID=1572761 RepID=A0ABV6PB10_9MICC
MSATSVDESIQNIFGPIVDFLETIVFFAVPIGDAELPLLVVWLISAGIFLTFWLRIRPIRDAKLSFKIIKGHYSRHSDPGQVTSFQALATELSGTIGLGNIAGVAVAISLGGPGATLWIILAGLLGMAVKMAEATLGQKYRTVHADGSVSGGPMYYLRDGLKSIGRPKLGKFLGLFYAAGMMIAVLGAGNIFQANQVTAQLVNVTGGTDSPLYGQGWIVGLVLALVAGVVIIGGIKSIARMTSRITPIMAVLYVLCVLLILAINIGQIPAAIATIFSSAFTGAGVTGGIIGVAIIGIQRAVFSNAAGTGTAAMAHAASKNKRPAEEGLVAAWEPFIDSVVICTMTALAIIVTGVYQDTTSDGVAMTTDAFNTVHDAFSILLTVSIALFGFSTILSFSYYGRKTTGYVFNQSKIAERAYDVVYVVFIVIGASVSLDMVVRFSDAMFFLVTVPNMLGIYFLAKVLRKEVFDHRVGCQTGQIPVVPLGERSTILGAKMSEKIDKNGGSQPSGGADKDPVSANASDR